MSCPRCLYFHLLCPGAPVRHCLNKLIFDDFRFLSTGLELFFFAQLKCSNFKLKSPTNLTSLERLLIVSNSLRFEFPFGQ